MKLPKLNQKTAIFCAFVAMVATYLFYVSKEADMQADHFSDTDQELLTFFCKNLELIRRLVEDASCGAKSFGDCVTRAFFDPLKAFCADPRESAFGRQALDELTGGMTAQIGMGALAKQAGCIK